MLVLQDVRKRDVKNLKFVIIRATSLLSVLAFILFLAVFSVELAEIS